MTNKRQHPRVKSDISVSIRLKSGGTVSAGRIRNISLGGVFIEMEPYKFGTELGLTFTLPTGSRLQCAGYVVWSTKNEPDRAGGMQGNGLRLTDISVADMRGLSEFVQHETEDG